MRLKKLIPWILAAALLVGCENTDKPDEKPDKTETSVQTVLLDEKLSAAEAKTIAASGTFKYSYTNYTLELINDNYTSGEDEYFVFQATIPVDEAQTSFQKIDPPVAVNKITGEIFGVYPDKLVPIAEDSFWGNDRNSTVEVARHYSWNGQFVRDDYYSVLNMVADDKQNFHFSLKLENAYGQCSLKSLEGKVLNTSVTNELNIARYEDPHSDFVIEFVFIDDETLQINTAGTNPYGNFGGHESPLDGTYILNKLYPA